MLNMVLKSMILGVNDLAMLFQAMPCQQLLETGDQSRTYWTGGTIVKKLRSNYIYYSMYTYIISYSMCVYWCVLRTTSMYWICQAFMKFHSFPPAEPPHIMAEGHMEVDLGLCNFHDGTMGFSQLIYYDLWLIVNDYEWLWFWFLAKMWEYPKLGIARKNIW